MHEKLPEVPWYVPSEHPEHDVEPMDGVMLPASHAMHTLAIDAPVVSLYLPASQASHTADPSLSWYVPAAQLEHMIAADPDE